MTSFWFCMFWTLLIVFIGSLLGIIFRKKIGRQQKERSLVGQDFHRRHIVNEYHRR
jgi:UPF0716 family protein affecting phage T7 exclusion